MKKWFTLVESLIVLIIISVITTVIFNMRFIWNDNRNIWQEVTNTIFKETQLLLKDFNRNKIYITWGNKYEIAYFLVNSNTSGSYLSISNQYIFPDTEKTNNFLQHIEETKLIENNSYKARNAIKWADELFFKIIIKSHKTSQLLVSKNWIVEEGNTINELEVSPNNYKIPTDNDIEVEGNFTNAQECQKILDNCEKNKRSEFIISCLNIKDFYKKNCPNILDFNTSKYSTTQWSTSDINIIVCAGDNPRKINQPIWKITISTAWKNASLEWCNNETIDNWIDCWKNICIKIP